MDVNRLWDELSQCEEVEAIAMGGSRAAGVSDQKSDYDIYIYVRQEKKEEKENAVGAGQERVFREIPVDRRREILLKYCGFMELGNHYWELEDNCTLLNGVDIDMIYRDLEDFENNLANVVEEGAASNGYSTCMWHNLKTCRILYDRDGRLQAMKNRFDVPYPNLLKRNIIEKNRKLLSGVLPSYDAQIKKAVHRRDKVSMNHRVTEFLASYFDILFALNEKTHPGEKRLISIGKETLSLLPERFEENLDLLFSVMYDGEVMTVIDRIIKNLDDLLAGNAR